MEYIYGLHIGLYMKKTTVSITSNKIFSLQNIAFRCPYANIYFLLSPDAPEDDIIQTKTRALYWPDV